MTLEVDLWIWSLDQPDRVSALSHLLSTDEQGRANRLVRPGDTERFVVGRGRLREVLSIYTGTPASALSFSYGLQGKPDLPGGPAFNLSHSDGWAALVVAPGATEDVRLGIDIEAERTVEKNIAEQYFSTNEYAALSGLPDSDRTGAFFRCWTRKEAVIKASGTGLSTPLDSFDVTLAQDDPARITRVSGDLEPVENWSLIHLDLASRFVGAIAAITDGEKIRLSLKEGFLPLW